MAESPAGVSQALPEGQAPHIDTEMEDSKIEEMPWSAQGWPATVIPQLRCPTCAVWNERCRRYIEDCGGSLYKLFTSISDMILQSLQDAERTQGGLKYILAKLQDIKHKAYKEQVHHGLKSTSDMDEESEVGWQDRSGEEDLQDLLECVCQVMNIEATIWWTLDTKSQSVPSKEAPPETKSDFDEEERRGKQEGKQDIDTGNTLSWCCNNITCWHLCCSYQRQRWGFWGGGNPRSHQKWVWHISMAFLITETFNWGVKLNKDDLQFVNVLWDNILNPACLQFVEWTGKPAKAMHEAITGVIASQVNQHIS